MGSSTPLRLIQGHSTPPKAVAPSPSAMAARSPAIRIGQQENVPMIKHMLGQAQAGASLFVLIPNIRVLRRASGLHGGCILWCGTMRNLLWFQPWLVSWVSCSFASRDHFTLWILVGLCSCIMYLLARCIACATLAPDQPCACFFSLRKCLAFYYSLPSTA